MNQQNEVKYEFYHRVPKTRVENLEYRKEIYTRCAKDAAFRKAVWIACSRDTLYFFNTFLWVYEPRPGMPCGQGKLPFITWPHQDRALTTLDRWWGLRDVRFWKTRGEGATWMVSMRQLKDWLFEPAYRPAAFGIVTRNEETVDSPDDSDSIMWKLDWQLKQLPKWMVPPFNRKVSEHSLKNEDTDSAIVGYAASEDVGSGGRKKVFMMDELAKFGYFRQGADYAAMASTFPVTECRVIISTPKGTANAYYDVITMDVDVDKYQVSKRVLTEEDHDHLASLGVIVLHWTDNPLRNRGMYRVDARGIVAVDEAKYGPIPEGYAEEWATIRDQLTKRGFSVNDTIRSPWYDRQCLRPGATPQSIAQELDLDFGTSGFTLFDADLIQTAKRGCRAPTMQGEMDYNEHTLEPEWVEHGNGRMRLWYNLQPDLRRPAKGDRFVVGADIASGLGGSPHSNSVASVINLGTGEQVGEWASNSVPPLAFCDQVIAIAKFFNNALIIHESNGPFGKAFTNQLKQREYGNIHRREDRYKVTGKRTREIGWGSNQESKADMLASLAHKIRLDQIKIRSRECVEELKSWVMKNGKVEHSKAMSTDDDSSKGASHGDRVIALGVAVMLYDPMNGEPVKDDTQEYLPKSVRSDTMAWRLRKWDDMHKKEADDW